MTLTITPRPKPCCSEISVDIAFDAYYDAWYEKSNSNLDGPTEEPDTEDVQITCDVCKGVWIVDGDSWVKTFPVETPVPNEPEYRFLQEGEKFSAGDEYFVSSEQTWNSVPSYCIADLQTVPKITGNLYRRQVK